MKAWYIRCQQYCPWWVWPFVLIWAVARSCIYWLASILVLFYLFCCTGCSVLNGLDELTSQIPDKYQDGKCAEYAEDLATRLAAVNIHGKQIAVWYKTNDRKINIAGSHTFVEYEFNNELWAVDNLLSSPMEISRKDSVQDTFNKLCLANEGRSSYLDIQSYAESRF